MMTRKNIPPRPSLISPDKLGSDDKAWGKPIYYSCIGTPPLLVRGNTRGIISSYFLGLLHSLNKGGCERKANPLFVSITTNFGKKGDSLHFCKVILIILLATLPACSPDRFALNENEGITVYGLIMSDLETAGKPDKYTNALHLRQNARIAMAASYLTQFEARFTVEMIEGNGMKFSMRTIADNFASHPSIQFLYDTFGSTIYENDMKINSVDSIKLSAMEKKLIRISNYGDYYTITVDCDTVYTGRTKLPATEYVIIETLDGTELFISGIKFAEIYETRTIYE